MPVIWCSVSGHGFGHAAQVIPVLNELGRRLPDLRVILRTTVPAKYFASRLDIAWDLSVSKQDIGCVQRGPLNIDVGATWEAHQRFHENWEEKLAREMNAIRTCSPDLILANISYLAIEAGARVGIPTVAIASLSWDKILEGLGDSCETAQKKIIQHIRRSYGHAHRLIRLAPGMMMDAFPQCTDVGPVGMGVESYKEAVADLHWGNTNDPLVLVGLGGVPLEWLPLKEVDSISGYRFIVDMEVSIPFKRIRSLNSFAGGFLGVLPGIHVIISKPGYATIVEAIAAKKRIVYIRRYNFADEGALVDYAHRFGQALELSKDDFLSGNWKNTLDKVCDLPHSTNNLPKDGIKEIVPFLMQLL